MNLKKEVKIMQTNTIFSVFVENLSELNEGNMVGCWVEFPCDYDEWKEVLAKIGNPEEIIITDTENYTDLESLPINQYSSYSDIQEIAEYIEYLQDDEYKEDSIYPRLTLTMTDYSIAYYGKVTFQVRPRPININNVVVVKKLKPFMPPVKHGIKWYEDKKCN